MIVILEDDRKSLKIWVRKSLRNLHINLHAPDILISFSNAKKIALAMLKRYPAKVVAFEEARTARLLVAVKVRGSALRALRALSTSEPLKGRKAAELLEKPTPRNILKALSAFKDASKISTSNVRDLKFG